MNHFTLALCKPFVFLYPVSRLCGHHVVTWTIGDVALCLWHCYPSNMISWTFWNFWNDLFSQGGNCTASLGLATQFKHHQSLISLFSSDFSQSGIEDNWQDPMNNQSIPINMPQRTSPVSEKTKSRPPAVQENGFAVPSPWRYTEWWVEDIPHWKHLQIKKSLLPRNLFPQTGGVGQVSLRGWFPKLNRQGVTPSH